MCSALLTTRMDRDEIDFELRDIDWDILDLLEEGRQTRQNLASVLDVTGEYVYQRVDLLIKLGIVEKIHDGFYELSHEYTESVEDSGTEEVVEYPDRREKSEPQTEQYADIALPDELAVEIDRYRDEQERSETDHVDARVRAARAVGRMLVAEGGVRRQEAVDALRDAYDVPGVTDETWWQRAGKDRFANVDRIQWDQQAQRYVLKE